LGISPSFRGAKIFVVSNKFESNGNKNKPRNNMEAHREQPYRLSGTKTFYTGITLNHLGTSPWVEKRTKPLVTRKNMDHMRKQPHRLMGTNFFIRRNTFEYI
jgi:hypothetical protein